MKSLFLILVLPLQAQFITPEWRDEGEGEHAQWDIFTEAKFEPNSPDVVSDDATITCTTSSAFITSSGNIYSFQSATAFQLNDSAAFPIQNVFLQISALGSEIDLEEVRLVTTDATGDTRVIAASQSFVISQDELGGERGGLGTTYALQWNLSEAPISTSYSILFESVESSLSLDQVSLDTSATFIPVTKPKPLELVPNGDELTLSWFGSWQLQSSTSLQGDWLDVPDTAGLNVVTLPMSNDTTFFRLKQLDVTP